MILDKEKTQEFEDIARPLIKWLNENCNPHVTVVVSPTSAELLESVCTRRTMDYVPD